MQETKAKTARINFTKEAIGRLKPPDSGRIYVYDDKVPGLAICLTSAGGTTFYYYRKINGKPERERIGPWPELTIDQARRIATSKNGKLAENKNQILRVKQSVPTLQEIFDVFIELPTRTRAKRPKSPKTVWGYRQIFNAYLSDWKDRKLSTITKTEIEKLHNRLGTENGHHTANRALELIRVLFNTAIDQDRVTVNPAARLSRFEEVERERFLYAEELPRFFEALEAEPSEKIRDFIKIALFTGQRRSNCLAMRWADVDLVRAVWNMPATKTGAHSVPLTAEVVKILNRRYLECGSGEFVFPGRHNGHLKDPMGRWREILKAAGISDLRIHDLRRSLGSWEASTGASLSVIGKTLGHSRPETTAIYSRLEMQPVRNAMETATAAILAAAKTKKKKGGKRGKNT